MADHVQNQVYKKIVWNLIETKEDLEAFMFGSFIDSPCTEILLGDNKTKW